MSAAVDLHLLKSLRCMSLFGLSHLSLLGRKKPSPRSQTAENEFHGKNPNSKRPRIVQTKTLLVSHGTTLFSSETATDENMFTRKFSPAAP